MAKRLKIYWDDLTDIYKKVSEQITTIRGTQKEITSTVSSINEAWTGADADKFKDGYTKELANIEKEIKILEEWSKYLDASAKKYIESEEEAIKYIEDLRNKFGSEYKDLY